jgi:hypothetical protein
VREFIESRLVFRFEDGWMVEKWDDQPAYRDADGFGALAGTGACDFMAWHETDRVYLIEVKNFVGHHHQNRERISQRTIAEEAACKFRDTLAGVLWVRGRRFDVPPLEPLLRQVAEKLMVVGEGDRRPSVVLWLEDRPPLSAASASAITSDLKRQLQRWFGIRRVLVTSLATFDPTTLPGFSVRPAP